MYAYTVPGVRIPPSPPENQKAPLWGLFVFLPSVVEDENPVRPTQPRSGMLAGSSRSERAESPPLSARQLATVRNRPFSYNSRNLPIEGQSHGHRNNVDNPYADLSVAGG